MKTFDITKLDKRHMANGLFKYRITFSGGWVAKYVEFNEMREWCWEIWGPSCERTLWCNIAVHNRTNKEQYPLNPSWAWHIEDRQLHIYLVNDEDLSHLKLKWC